MKKFTVIHYSLLALSLMYSFMFYVKISPELAVMAIIFDIFKPVLFIQAIDSKSTKKIVFSSLVVILVIFNLLAISSSFINNYSKQTTVKSINPDYKTHNKKLAELKSNVEVAKTDLNNYPTLDKFLEKSPRWEDKTQLNQNWQQGKQDIENRLTAATTAYSKELSVKVDKYKVEEKQNGYNAIFAALGNELNIESKDLVLVLYLLFAVMLEILIFYSKSLSNKELKSYTKTNEELTAELMKEIQLEMHRKQLEMIKSNFNKILEGQKNKVPDDIKIIEESKIEDVDQKFLTENSRDELKEVDPVVFDDKKFDSKAIDIKNIESYLNYLNSNSKDDIAIGYKKVADGLGLTQSEARRIFEKLKEKNYLIISDRKTVIEKKEFKESDFEEEV